MPKLKLRLFRFKNKHVFCKGENFIRFGSTLDAQIGALTEKKKEQCNYMTATPVDTSQRMDMTDQIVTSA